MTRIFVYGTLKRGGCRSFVLNGQRLLTAARTAAKYRMYNTGSFPALVEEANGLQVEGEVWEVDDDCLRILDGIEAVPDLYERVSVTLADPSMENVETYIYRQSVSGMPDCGVCWEPTVHESRGQENMEVVYFTDVSRPAFEQARGSVDVVCAGDSITGWNNFGPVGLWPYPTYPQFLQQLCAPSGLQVADGGIAGEVSDNGLGHVQRYLELFPNSRHFIIGFGTNDLGMWPDLRPTSRRILDNLHRMVQTVRDDGKQPLLLNVPYANESMFAPHIARDTHEKRDYHNRRLLEYCRENGVPLADIGVYLRDEHFGDELHPNQAGAKAIAERVFVVLKAMNAGG